MKSIDLTLIHQVQTISTGVDGGPSGSEDSIGDSGNMVHFGLQGFWGANMFLVLVREKAMFISSFVQGLYAVSEI